MRIPGTRKGIMMAKLIRLRPGNFRPGFAIDFFTGERPVRTQGNDDTDVFSGNSGLKKAVQYRWQQYGCRRGAGYIIYDDGRLLSRPGQLLQRTAADGPGERLFDQMGHIPGRRQSIGRNNLSEKMSRHLKGNPAPVIGHLDGFHHPVPDPYTLLPFDRSTAANASKNLSICRGVPMLTRTI